MKVYRVKGTTDDVTVCDNCGRADLKATVVLAALDPDGNEDGITYLGSDCAAKAAGWTQSRVRSAARAANREAQRKAFEAEERCRSEESKAFEAAYADWLQARYGDTDQQRVISRLRRSDPDNWPEYSPYRLRKACRQELHW